MRAGKGESIPEAIDQSFRRAPRRVGAYLVHFGVIVTFVAIAISANYQLVVETTMAPGQTTEVGSYQLTYNQVRVVEEPHMTAQRAELAVTRGGKSKGLLEPALNHYPSMREPIGTPAVRSTLTHDLYLTVMNVDEAGRLGLKAIVTPAVYWIWIGVFIMVLGTMVCLVPPKKARVRKTDPAMEPATS